MVIDIDMLRQVLIDQSEQVVRLGLLFGSYADNSAGPDSDIDIALLFDGPMSTNQRSMIVAGVGAEFGLPVDLVDLYHYPYPVTGQALAGKRLIGDDETYADVSMRHLTNHEDFGPLHNRLINDRLDQWLQK